MARQMTWLTHWPSPGRYVCPGEQLAWLQMRHIAAQVVRRYNISLAPGFTRQDLMDGLKEGVTLSTTKMALCLTRRDGAERGE